MSEKTFEWFTRHPLVSAASVFLIGLSVGGLVLGQRSSFNSPEPQTAKPAPTLRGEPNADRPATNQHGDATVIASITVRP